jgi:hypothetical protein
VNPIFSRHLIGNGILAAEAVVMRYKLREIKFGGNGAFVRSKEHRHHVRVAAVIDERMILDFVHASDRLSVKVHETAFAESESFIVGVENHTGKVVFYPPCRVICVFTL